MKAVPIEELSAVWPTVEPWIIDALEHGQGDEGGLDVLIALARGVYTLWVTPTFAAVTQVVRHPKQTVLTLVYAGGSDLEAMQRAFEFATSYCRQHGIDVVRVWGREGWEKLLGLERVGVILQKVVT